MTGPSEHRGKIKNMPESKKPLPALFCGHGNPMNALNDNAYTNGWATLGAELARPKSVLSISAHWYRPGTHVTAISKPPTIHDFSGFPPELYRMAYPADGDPGLARRVRNILAPTSVTLDNEWGLDHGTWSVLTHLLPKADIPVVQLSIDSKLPPASHFEIGKRLSPLRDEDVLIFGSGNLVHNLSAYAWSRPNAEPFDWALRFEKKARAAMLAGDNETLIEYKRLGDDAVRSIPTPEHYLPMLYIMALRKPGEPMRFPVEGFDGGSVSMLTVQIGE